MKLSEQGIQLIKNFEGLRLVAYRDVAGIWTIGYGSTRYNDGTTVKPGDKLSGETAASALFNTTLSQYEDAVDQYVKVSLTQPQFDALVSFTYNEGTGALKGSTLLKRLNAGDYQGAADQLLRWNRITGPNTGEKIECETLTARRQKERALFLSATIPQHLNSI